MDGEALKEFTCFVASGTLRHFGGKTAGLGLQVTARSHHSFAAFRHNRDTSRVATGNIAGARTVRQKTLEVVDLKRHHAVPNMGRGNTRLGIVRVLQPSF